MIVVHEVVHLDVWRRRHRDGLGPDLHDAGHDGVGRVAAPTRAR